MKVILVKPSNLSDHIQPSLGLGYIAGGIRGEHEVYILDCYKEKVKVRDIAREVLKFNPDIVGIQCYTFDVFNVKRILDSIKSADRRIITVIGGPHISALPFQTMEFFKDTCDFGFVGEAESGFRKFLRSVEKRAGFEEVKGLIWRNRDGGVVLNNNVQVEDLDSLGYPSWDILKPEEYPPSQHGAFFKNFPIAPIITTRGCPYKCAFCVTPHLYGKKLRHHSVEYVCREIEYLYNRHGIREFHIIDDAFTSDINYAKKVCRGILSLNLNVSFATPNGVRMNNLDSELLGLMKECGFYSLSVAPESGSERILFRICKSISLKEITAACKKIKDFGFKLTGFFILGFPGETEEDINETINFSKTLGLDRANFFCFLPIPGSQLYQELLASGEIENVDWKNFYFMSAPYVPQSIPSRRSFLNIKRRAFFSFYARPGIFLENLKGIKSIRHFYYLVKRAYRWLLKY
jgi:radical SAM superfamily enzyme YgiQ (UPF0313 family)